MRYLICVLLLLLLNGCQPAADDAAVPTTAVDAGHDSDIDQTVEPATAESHVDNQRIERRLDDLLTSGLGVSGLREPPPVFANPAAPTPEELRRLALHTNYRALQDVAEASGFGLEHELLQATSGVEILAWRELDGLRYPHAVAMQIPDSFNVQQPCLVVAAASGSRGVYGAAAVVGDWALSHHCAAIYTDKGAGTGFYDLDSGQGLTLDGKLTARPTGYQPDSMATGENPIPYQVAIKHAHSTDNPEARWGDFVLDAARFAVAELQQRFADLGQLRIIGAGISNGGSAVLRAAEADHAGLLDAVVAGEPNIYPPAVDAVVATAEARYPVSDALPLYSYATELGLFQPCALLHDITANDPFGAALAFRQAELAGQCEQLLAAGRLADAEPESASRALDKLLLTPSARRLGLVNFTLGLWPAVTAAYAQAYQRQTTAAPVCGIGYAAVGTDGKARPTTLAERAGWFATSSGIAPTAGLVLVDQHGQALTSSDALVNSASCWHELARQTGTVLQQSLATTRSTARIKTIPVLIVHGQADSLVLVNHSSRPYVAAGYQQGSAVYYYEIEHANHFDALLGAPGMRDHIVAIHPYLVAALEQAWNHLENAAAIAPSQLVRTRPGTDYSPSVLINEPGDNAIVFAGGVLVIPE